MLLPLPLWHPCGLVALSAVVSVGLMEGSGQNRLTSTQSYLDICYFKVTGYMTLAGGDLVRIDMFLM